MRETATEKDDISLGVPAVQPELAIIDMAVQSSGPESCSQYWDLLCSDRRASASPIAARAGTLAQLVRDWLEARDKISAFEPIYKVCFPMARLYFLRRGPASEADDLAQKTMWDVYRGLGHLRESSQFESWFFTIARNKRADWFASHSSVVTMPLPEPSQSSELMIDPAGDPEHLAASSQFCSKFRDAIERLSPQERRCLTLRMEGYSGGQVAELLMISVSTVKTHWRTAGAKLRTALGEDYPWLRDLDK
jgi:RNA polymerase sigma factor (sigma-70 family)